MYTRTWAFLMLHASQSHMKKLFHTQLISLFIIIIIDPGIVVKVLLGSPLKLFISHPPFRAPVEGQHLGGGDFPDPVVAFVEGQALMQFYVVRPGGFPGGFGRDLRRGHGRRPIGTPVTRARGFRDKGDRTSPLGTIAARWPTAAKLGAPPRPICKKSRSS